MREEREIKVSSEIEELYSRERDLERVENFKKCNGFGQRI